MIKALVVSDSHGNSTYMKQVIKDEKPDMLIHAGDVEDSLYGILGPVDFYIHVVKGNCDTFVDAPLEEIFNLGKRKVLLIHGHMCGGAHIHPFNHMEEIVAYAKSKGCDMLIYGHTHIPDFEEREDGFIIVNPGSISRPRQIDRQKTYAILEVKDDKVNVIQKSYD